MEESNQVIQDGFQEVSNSIENLRWTIEDYSNNSSFSSNNGSSSILIIILIVVLISINNNIKKLTKAITDKDQS